MTGQPASALAVLDWRRRTHAMYDAVRDSPSPESAHAAWRMERDRMFAEHAATPLLPEDRPGFVGLDVPAYDAAWRFEVVVEPTDAARLEVQTGTDGVVPFERIGAVHLPGIGSLDVWRLASYGGGIFLPVRDASAGLPGGTYGGGRYLIDTVKGADLGGEDGRLVVDLNFAYNPSCAYDPEWACPLAPAGNRLDVAIPVGERSFHG